MTPSPAEERTIERIRARSMRSNGLFFRCVSEEQLAFGRELGIRLERFITVGEAFEALRYHINTSKSLPPTKAGTRDGDRRKHLQTNEVLRDLAIA